MLPISVLLLWASLVASVKAFSSTANNNVALYWGQNSYGNQERLSYYCELDSVDIVILSFVTGFPDLSLNFANQCSDSFSDGLLHCSEIGEDITTCQNLGKLVLLSLGGASGSYGFSDDSEAEEFATTLWNKFGGGTDSERPFDDAIVDGFDFDLENNDSTGTVALGTQLRLIFLNDTSRSYYLSAAPQCPYPDASTGDMLAGVDMDFAFIQFYNNYCNLGSEFNWDTWQSFAEETSPNKDIKLYVGLPGASSSAGSGYADLATVEEYVTSDILENSNFGGFMLWDATSGVSNVNSDGESFIDQLKDYMNSEEGTTSATSTSSTSTSSTLSTSSSSSTSTLNAFTTSTSSSTSSSVAALTTSQSSVSTASSSSSSSQLSSSVSSTVLATSDAPDVADVTSKIPSSSSETATLATPSEIVASSETSAASSETSAPGESAKFSSEVNAISSNTFTSTEGAVSFASTVLSEASVSLEAPVSSTKVSSESTGITSSEVQHSSALSTSTTATASETSVSLTAASSSAAVENASSSSAFVDTTSSPITFSKSISPEAVTSSAVAPASTSGSSELTSKASAFSSYTPAEQTAISSEPVGVSFVSSSVATSSAEVGATTSSVSSFATTSAYPSHEQSSSSVDTSRASSSLPSSVFTTVQDVTTITVRGSVITHRVTETHTVATHYVTVTYHHAP